MRPILAMLGALTLAALLVVPALAADEPWTDTGRVLVSIQGDVTVPAGEHADAVVVVNGNATVLGSVRALTVVEGTATLEGARVETLAIINGTANLGPGTQVTRDVLELNSTIARDPTAVIGGNVRSLAADLAGAALFIGAAALLLWIGVGLATIVAGLALAAFAARQVRTAEAIISREPLKAVLVGLLMIVVPPIVVFALALTILGLPLAISVLLFVWPALAFVGYLVAAIWLGDWLLRTAGRPAGERPYLAAFVGLVLAMLLGFIPLISAVISLFGLGAVTIAGWRTLTGGQAQPRLQASPAPMAS